MKISLTIGGGTWTGTCSSSSSSCVRSGPGLCILDGGRYPIRLFVLPPSLEFGFSLSDPFEGGGFATFSSTIVGSSSLSSVSAGTSSICTCLTSSGGSSTMCSGGSSQ